MKILVAAEQWFPDYAGGTGRVAQATSVALANRGHGVDVLVPEVEESRARQGTDGLCIHRRIKRGVLPQTYTDARATAIAGRRLARAFDVGVAHHPSSAVGLARLEARLPVVYVFHASPSLEAKFRRATVGSPLERLRSRAVEPVLARLERLAARQAARVVVLSNYSRSILVSAMPAVASKIDVIPGGVDITEFGPSPNRRQLRARLGIAEGEHLILTVRRLVSRMGIDVLLRAFAEVRSVHKSSRLVVVGEGEERHNLELLTERLGLAAHVAFVGRVEDHALRDWYAASDLFALPTVAYEGYGMATVEALASGTPVIGTPVGATPEVLASIDSRMLSSEATAPALAAAVGQLLSTDLEPLRARCRAHAVDSLDWRRVIIGWEDSVTLAQRRRC